MFSPVPEATPDALRSVDSLTVKELYTIKNETENRALNAKLLSSLFEKPSTLGAFGSLGQQTRVWR